ncbi:13894_t:CDS:2 [Ambispora leptoticha]|uniref:13894_t:CDS:1 n=1 Tax=Ambispora leptoticha TaxID=144679 RepID=A0A9N8VN72_9GLOM|nr:13894_t:CDS:2 [Ambispora leptoticha]
MLEDKYIGVTLAILSSLAIGTSFIITKKGLIDTTDRHGSASEDHKYLRNPIWWGGMLTMIVGELANFAAYSFAPAILITPLGALSVLIGALLASIFLDEKLGRNGTVGCGLCLIGSVIIVLHAPGDKEIRTVDEILNYALNPGFLTYCTFVVLFTGFMITRLVPKYGKKNPLVYLSICSLVGSISVMSCKGFGIALKLTFSGNNQFSHPSTYVFVIISAVCIVTQMNYFNKALDQFSTNLVNPIYYVFFTTSTIAASVILFQGFNTSNTVNVISLFCGFLTIFAGVYLLNTAKSEFNKLLLDKLSMHQNGNGLMRASLTGDGRSSITLRRDTALLSAFEEENIGLTDLRDDTSDSEEDRSL